MLRNNYKDYNYNTMYNIKTMYETQKYEYKFGRSKYTNHVNVHKLYAVEYIYSMFPRLSISISNFFKAVN